MTYPKLGSLKLSLNWYSVPVSIREAIIGLLLRSHKLESLDLSVVDIPLHLFACLPPTVKHLTGHIASPHPSWEPHVDAALPGPLVGPPNNSSIVVELDTFTQTRAHSAWYFNAILFHGLPISLNSLKHLQIGGVGWLPHIDATYARILSLCSNTLQCLHIGVSDYITRPNTVGYRVPDTPIPLGELRSLKALEIRTDTTYLKRTLRWLSDSIATISPEETHEFMQRLKISLLFSHALCCECLPCLKRAKFNRAFLLNPRAASPTAWHQKCWERTMSTWPDLGLANFSLFLEHFNHATRRPLITEEPPMAFEHSGDYALLWDGCPCSGWRYQT
ncbi:hypothetical protein BKA70DRAFT_1332502 [Coprinopsis sp. MPI-PUGE-AT-0042]|nr:hypothetical protein BKA70DRAFT_1332502 [Coprinopsis sp. MPI-PUGE-AT-0042]